MLLTRIATLDAVLDAHATALGTDFDAYRNHTYRLVNFCAQLRDPEGDGLERIAIAAAFHDLGIWTAQTFDYLDPSVALARVHLSAARRTEWEPEVEAMILQHHKITRARRHPAAWLVEPFRQADWIDVTRGLRRFGLPRRALLPVFAAWPDAGFHRRLFQLSASRLRTHPWNPLPMFRF
jgi:hypothetical protein